MLKKKINLLAGLESNYLSKHYLLAISSVSGVCRGADIAQLAYLPRVAFKAETHWLLMKKNDRESHG